MSLEYRLLAELAAHAGRVLTLRAPPGAGLGREGQRSEPHRNIVNKLRAKLGDDANRPTYIFTEPRVGYWMPEGEGRGEEPW